MKIYEYRIIVPIEYAHYIVGNRFMALEYVKSETANGEGIEVVKSEQFDGTNSGKTDIRGEKGTHTEKIYHIKSKIPGFIRWAVPDKYLHFYETSYNCFPHFLTMYDVPGMGKDFDLRIESQHVKYEHGMKDFPNNATKLNSSELKKRKIVWLDIINGIPKKSEFSLKGYKCEKADLDFTRPEFKEGSSSEQSSSSNAPDNIYEDNEEVPEDDSSSNKPPEWTTKYKGEMTCAIKVVKFHFKWLGLQTAVEKLITHSVYPKMFTDSHRRMIRCMDQWYGLTMEDIYRIESEVFADQKQNTKFES